MHGPTRVFWASLTAFSLKVKAIWAKHNPEKLKTVHGPGPPGRLSALSVFLCKSVFYGAFVWARRALNMQKRRFPARAVMKAKYDTKMKEEALLLALQEKYEAEVDDKDL